MNRICGIKCFSEDNREWLPLLHGQSISLMIAGTGFFASLLSSEVRFLVFCFLFSKFNYLRLYWYLYQGVNVPVFLSFLNYVLLSTCLIRLCRSSKTSRSGSDDIISHEHDVVACSHDLDWPWCVCLHEAHIASSISQLC